MNNKKQHSFKKLSRKIMVKALAGKIYLAVFRKYASIAATQPGSTRHIYLAVMELSAATDLLRAAREDQQALTTGTVQLDGLVPHIHQASGMVAREERPHARAAP